MERRRFLLTSLAGVLVTPRAAQAQAGKVYRIGYLGAGSQMGSELHQAFEQALGERGWVSGENLAIAYRQAEGQYDRLPALAAEMVRLEPRVIVAVPTVAARAARDATTTIPIVMMFVSDPIAEGLIASFARPGGNVTGLTLTPTREIFAKQLQLLKEAVPRARRIAFLWNLANPTTTGPPAVRIVEEAARSLGVELQVVGARAPEEFEPAFRAMTQARADALLVHIDSMFFTHRARLADLSGRHRLPAIYGAGEHAKAGGLMAYGGTWRTRIAGPPATWTRSSEGPSLATCPSSSRRGSSCPSTSRPPRPSASPPRCRCCCGRTPPGAGAQAGKTYRIGWLAPAANPNNLSAFRNGLRPLGYVEGKNVVIEQRYAEDGGEQLDRAAARLVRSNLDVIVTDGSAATTALKRTATSTSVVFVSGDPVAMGLVSSLSRPGGTMTGFAIISTELNVKRLELLRETIPQASRLGVLHEPRHRQNIIPPIAAGARSLGFQLTLLEVRAVADIEGAFAAAVRERVAVVMPVASALFHAEKQKLVSLAAKHRLPTMYDNGAFAEAGGLMSYGPDVAEIFRRAATYVDKILTGTRPADLPIDQPTKFDLVINLKTAKSLGLTIPPSVLARADQVIE